MCKSKLHTVLISVGKEKTGYETEKRGKVSLGKGKARRYDDMS